MDKFILNKKDQSYKKKIKLEKEERKSEDKEHNPQKQIQKDMIVYKNQDMKKNKISEGKDMNDFFHIREKGDNLLNKWIIQQKEPIIIFLSEFIPGTKVSKEIEQFRPIIKTTPTISIEEYRKKKKIGEEGVEYLKRLKEKYGIIVLKVLWSNLNFL
jgi:hypothetical protein